MEEQVEQYWMGAFTEINFKIMDIQPPIIHGGYINFPNRIGDLTVKFNVQTLIEKLEQNLRSHCDKYTSAMVAYRKIVMGSLKKTLDSMEKGAHLDLSTLKFVAPVEYSKEYQRVISMLRLTTDKEIELDENRYDQLMLDNWNWKREFEQKTCMYLTGNE